MLTGEPEDTAPRFLSSQEHEARMKVVRRFARGHLGDQSWADAFLDAYLKPTETTRQLDAAEAAYDD